MKFAAAFVLSFASAFLVTGVTAFPSGAGRCVGGEAAVDGSHKREGAESGSLADGGVEFEINSRILRAGDTFYGAVGVEYDITITATDDPIKGVLVRLESRDVDIEDVLEPARSSVDLLQDAAVCAQDDGLVFGVTHNSNEPKDEIELILLVDEVTDITIDVTVVMWNNATGSAYFFDEFFFEIDSEAPSESPTQTDAPTIGDASPAPTVEEIVEDPTGSPTGSPSVEEGGAGTEAPVVVEPEVPETEAPVEPELPEVDPENPIETEEDKDPEADDEVAPDDDTMMEEGDDTMMEEGDDTMMEGGDDTMTDDTPEDPDVPIVESTGGGAGAATMFEMMATAMAMTLAAISLFLM